MPDLLTEFDQATKPTNVYQPSDKEMEVISAIWTKWLRARAQREQQYRHFNDRSLREYVSDSVDRWNGYVPPRQDPAADWGAKVFDNVTRNKVISIMAQVTAEQTKAEFFATLDGDEGDRRAAELMKHLHDYTWYKNKDDEQQFYTVLEANVKGTAVGYEGYKLDRRTIKEIDNYNPDTGEISFHESTIEDYNDVYGEIIPLLDFYPGNIFVRDMQKQPYVIWRTVMDWDVFQAEFEHYDNAKNVLPASSMTMNQAAGEATQMTREDRSMIMNETYVSQNLLPNQVEVLRYFDKWNDEFHITANNTLLTKTTSPLPWDHKNYPFWKTVYEPFETAFFYGKSLPDKLKYDQDVLNSLYEMMLDQSYLSINPPILTQGVEGIRDEFLYPGRRIQVEDVTQTREMNISAPGNAHFQMIQMVKTNIDKSSYDNALSGLSGTRITAFQVGIAKEQAQKILAVFLRTLEWGVRDKMDLRIKNILQFYRLPMKIAKIAGEDKVQYRQIILQNSILADGTKGKQVVNIVNGPGDLPTQQSLNDKELGHLNRGENVALSYVTTEMLKSIDLTFRIIPNSSLQMSEALKRALELDYQQKANLLYGDLLNRDEAFREFNEAFDKDPMKMTNQGQSMMQPGQPGQPGQAPPSAPPGANPGAVPPGGIQPAQQGAVPIPRQPFNAAQAGVPTLTSNLNSLRNSIPNQ